MKKIVIAVILTALVLAAWVCQAQYYSYYGYGYYYPPAYQPPAYYPQGVPSNQAPAKHILPTVEPQSAHDAEVGYAQSVVGLGELAAQP